MFSVLTALSLILTAVALAAQPKAGHMYAGYTSAVKINNFGAPVSFKVAMAGGKLMSFKYGDTGCPTQTPPTGNPYLPSGSIVKVGTLLVSSAGAFSIKNLKTTTAKIAVTGGTQTNYTISTITGKFKTAKTATGTIKMTNGFSAPGIDHNCGTSTVTFTATAK